MTAFIETNGLGKQYGRKWALRDCTRRHPRRQGRRARRAERCRQDDAVALGRRTARTQRGLHHRARRTPGQRRRPSSTRSASSPRTPRSTPGCRWRSTFAWAPTSIAIGTTSSPRAGSRSSTSSRARQAGSLSGGQRAQLALTLAIARRPELLLLDEPVASLDPLARREFLQSLMEIVANEHVSVMLSSHLIADLERVCDYLVILMASRVQLFGEVSELLGTHWRLTGPRRDPGSLPSDQESHRGKPHRSSRAHSSCAPTSRSSIRPGT